MSTFAFLHAHPDDESILTGGTIARLADHGHRVIVVYATNGEHGEVPADLAEGETVADRRRAEAARSAEILGAQRVAWLGYADSGMTGWAQNSADGAFATAPVDEAAARLALILGEESADVLVAYDWHGNYGHPDHIAVHRVGHRAAELAGTPRLLEATVNRDWIARMSGRMKELNPDGEEFDIDAPADDGNPMGEPESAIAWMVDVGAYAARKRASIAAHASQVSDASFFLQMGEDDFARAFGHEWYIEPERSGPPQPWVID